MNRIFKFVLLALSLSLFGGKGLNAQIDEKDINYDGSRQQILFTNGPFTNSPGTGPEGTDESLIPDLLFEWGYTTHKPNTSGIEYRVADDFTVEAPLWQIDSIEFFGFTAATTLDQVFDKYTIQIWEGVPGDPNSRLLWGDETTNRYLRSKFAGFYRQCPNEPRPVFRNMCATPELVLPEGDYWIDWNARAVPNSTEALVPPVVINLEEPVTGNARKALGREWENILDREFPQGLPFIIYGTPVKDPVDVALLEIVSPVSDVMSQDDESFVVKIKNNGTQSLNQVQVVFYVNGQLIGQEAINQQLDPGVELVFQSQTLVDLPEETSRIKVELLCNDEQYTKNNVREKFVDRYENAVLMGADVLHLDFANFFDDGGPKNDHSQGASGILTVYPQSDDDNARMSVEFMEFDLYYAAAYLKVYNGVSTDFSNEIALLSHGHVPQEFRKLVSTDSTGALTFEFFSNGNTTRPGWKARLKTVVEKNHDLELIDIQVPEHVSSGVDFPCKVGVKNNGLSASGEFALKVYDDNNSLLAQHSETNLQPGQIISFTSSVNLNQQSSRFLKAVIEYGQDMDVENNSSEELFLNFQEPNIGLVTVGSADSLGKDHPLSIFHYNSITQMLYYPDEIPAGISITDIAFKYSFEHRTGGLPVKVWIGETDLETLEGNYISPDDLNLVFDQTVDMEKGCFDLKLEFSEPYQYTGGNLVVMVHRAFKPWGSSQNFFWCSNTPSRPGRSMHIINSSVVLDVNNPRYMRYSDVLPHTRFYFDSSQPASVKGVVRTQDSEPLSKATISLNGGEHLAVTGSNGLFWLQNLQPGEYQAKVSRHGYSQVVEDIIISAAQTLSFDPVMEPAPAFFVNCMVRKFEDPSQHLPGVTFEFSNADTTFTAMNDAGGLLLIPNVEGNTDYHIKATHDDYKTVEYDIYLDQETANLPVMYMQERTAAVGEVIASLSGDNSLIEWPAASSTYEIAYDNGEIYTRTTSGHSFAVRFTPLGYPCDVVKARINLYEDGILSPDVPPAFKVTVWDDNGADGLPGSILWEQHVQADEYGWFEVDVDGIVITEGDFYISATKTGEGYLFYSCDNQQATHSYKQSWEGGDWSFCSYDFHRNHMFRAIVEGVAGKSELSSSGTNRETLGYNIYRFAADNESDQQQWELLSENYQNTSFTDISWNELPFGEYKYAVKTYYTGGNLSSAVISNPLDKDMFVEGLQVNFLPFGDQPLKELEFLLIPEDGSQPAITGVTNADGQALVNNVRKGTYTLFVRDRRFIPVNDEVNVLGDPLAEVELIYQPQVPMFVSASVQDESPASISWDDPSELIPLAFDDGTIEWNVSSGQSNPVWIGNQFYSHGGRITAIAFYAEKNPFTESESFTIDIFNENKELIGTSESFMIIPDSWNYVAVDNLPVDGEFYAMINFDSPQVAQHYIGIDANGPEAWMNKARYYNGTLWEELNSHYGSYWPDCNVMMRVFIDPAEGHPGEMQLPSIFNVFKIRKAGSPENDQWSLVAEEVSQDQTVDNNWQSGQWGEYVFAVSSVNAQGEESEYGFSNIIEKDMLLDAEITVATNSTYVPDNVLVSLVNLNDPEFSYAETADEDGIASFAAVKRGNYHLRVVHRNFQEYNQDVDFSEEGQAEVTLIERALPVGGVKAEIQDSYNSIISWSDPNSMISLGYDDGTCENGISPFAYDNLWLGNGFAINSAVTIESFDIYSMANPEGVEASLTVDFFDENLELIGSSEEFTFADNDWVNVLVPSVDFYGGVLFAMIHWYNVPGETNYMGLDQNGPNAEANVSVSYNGVAWGYTQPLFPGVFMLRANVLSNGKKEILEPLDFALEELNAEPALSMFEKSAKIPAASHGLRSGNSYKESVAVYDVYRLQSGQEEDQHLWELVANQVSETSVNDDSWDILVPGLYKYAVKATYPSGVSSVFIFSNEIQNNGFNPLSVSFEIKDDQGNDISDAVITLNDTEYEPGHYVFDDVQPGTWSYTVRREGYQDAAGDVTVEDEDVVLEVVLAESGFTVSFVIEDEQGQEITDAVVTLSETEYDSGQYDIPDVVPGTYSYTVSRSGYFDESGSLTVVDQDIELTIVMRIDDSSIGDLDAQLLNVFPNPASADVNIHSSSLITGIRLFDMQGRTVIQTRVDAYEHKIPLKGIKEGLYFINIMTVDGNLIRKIQVAR